MTNQEAIQMLKSKLDGSVDASYEWCECVRLAINAAEEYGSLLEECERKLSYLLDFEIESTLESQKVKGLINKIQEVMSVYKKPSQQDIYKAVLGLWSPEDALTTVQEMNEKAKEVMNITDEWDRVRMTGDKRAIAQYKADHGYTMTKEEMDILEEESKWQV